jgi:hypothetical protein
MPTLYFLERDIKTARGKTAYEMENNAKDNAHELVNFRMEAIEN